jgi:hypothetical protein
MKALAVLLVALAGGVVAIAAPAPSFTNVALETTAEGPLSAVQVQNGVSYLNGGAGEQDVVNTKSRSSEFALQILFSGRGGEYGVAQSVTVRSGARDVITVPDAGPYLMMKLPPGRYEVEASFKGTVEKRTAVVGNGVTRINWNTLRASD